MLRKCLLLAFGLSVGIVSPIDGQELPDPAASASIQVGPLALAPIFAITGIGIDSNVFNTAEDQKRDFTATVRPEVQAWLRIGRARAIAESHLDLVYFKEYADQGGVNTANSVRFEVPLYRLRPYVADTFLNVQERPGPEIDTRARRLENLLTAGVDVRFSHRAWLDANVSRSVVSFDDEATFQDASLKQELDRRSSRVAATVSYDMTPLTRLICVLEREEVRFKFSPERDSNSVSVMPGFEFRPFALVTGRVRVGFLNFEPIPLGVPGFSGITTAIDASYRLLGSTQFGVGLDRDVSYSVDTVGYYVQTSLTGSVTHYVNDTWSISGNAATQRLGYPEVVFVPGGASGTQPGRTDAVYSFGASVGYRVGRDLQFDVHAVASTRRSEIASGEYDNLRMFGSFTYEPH